MKILAKILLCTICISCTYKESSVTYVSKHDYIQEATFLDGQISDYNLGSIKKSTLIYHSFTFKNQGNIPIFISSVGTGCGCISTQYSKEIVKPGKTFSLKVTFNTRNEDGYFRKKIYILFNNGRFKKIISIKGNII